MARMVFGSWATGSRHEQPRGGRPATHKRLGALTACGRPAARLHALANTTAPNGTEMVDCKVCLRQMASGGLDK